MKRLVLIAFWSALALRAALPAAAAEPTGKEVFDHYCAACHGTEEGTGTMQLGRTRGKDQAFLTKRKNLKAEYIEYVVRHGLRSMPPFAPADLDEVKLKALSAFLAK